MMDSKSANNSLPRGAQAQIARDLGLSRQAVSKAMQGKFRNPVIDAATKTLRAQEVIRQRAVALRAYLATLDDCQLVQLLPKVKLKSSPKGEGFSPTPRTGQ